MSVDDVTKDQLIELTGAAIELLSIARCLHWEADGKADTPEMDRMSKALSSIGLPQPTREECDQRIRAVLAMPAEVFVEAIDAIKKERG